MCVCVCSWVHTWKSSGFTGTLHLSVLRQDLSLGPAACQLDLAIWSPSPGIHLLPLPELGHKHTSPHPALHSDAADPARVLPHACETNTLLSEPAPQPHVLPPNT